MRIINATPHPLDIHARHRDDVVVLPTSAWSPRIEEANTEVKTVVDGVEINVCEALIWKMDTLPAEQAGVFYVVSRPYAMANGLLPRPRRDLLVPGPAVRDANGRQTGCYGLSHFTIDLGAQGPLAK